MSTIVSTLHSPLVCQPFGCLQVTGQPVWAGAQGRHVGVPRSQTPVHAGAVCAVAFQDYYHACVHQTKASAAWTAPYRVHIPAQKEREVTLLGVTTEASTPRGSPSLLSCGNNSVGRPYSETYGEQVLALRLFCPALDPSAILLELLQTQQASAWRHGLCQVLF